MPESERPPRDEFDDDVESSKEAREGARRLVERIIREGVRRAVEKGVEQITETPDHLRAYLHEIKLPRELAGLLLGQAEETKNGLYRAVAREIRDFLEHTNLAEEVVKALTTLSFEIKTEIRFIPNDQRRENDTRVVRPDVRATVRLRDEDKEKERDKERDRDREREPNREREKERERDKEREREREKPREKDRSTEES